MMLIAIAKIPLNLVYLFLIINKKNKLWKNSKKRALSIKEMLEAPQ
jgi:hypothetical protein